MDFSKIDLTDNQELAREIVRQAVKEKFKNREEFQKFRNQIIKKRKGAIFHNLYFIKAYNDLLKEGEIKESIDFLKLIQKRSVRTLSGVAPLTVMTKPFPCPGKCIYCPTDVRMPKSYIPSQPAAQRGLRQRFDPYSQVFARLKALATTGHAVSKVELRILGGTWSSYPKTYQTWFVKRCLQAMNEFPEQMKAQNFTIESSQISNPYEKNIDKKTQNINTLIIKPLSKKPLTIAQVIKTNESAEVKCIGINIETRPDHITREEVKRLRKLGVTKVEMGVQTTDDKVQEITKRGHDLQEVKRAAGLLRDSGFKLSFHMMPNLPGSTIEKDKKMIAELFADEWFQPDYLKIYPCVVMPRTPLATMYQQNKYQPYNDETLEEILLEQLKAIPYWCRIDRLARDIPADEIEAGTKVSNIRQILEKRLESQGYKSKDIRSREIKEETYDPDKIKLIIRKYASHGGKEIFLSYEDLEKDKLIGLLRLRFPHRTFIKELKNAALIREVHVYGQQVKVGEKASKDKTQHLGIGTKLLKDAEKITREAGFKRLCIIAGIGTRDYYAKKGFHLEGTYMLMNL
jgi:elongator complex protein 3